MDIATIFKKHIPEYLNKFGKKIPYNHLKTINDILQCRTASLGGEVYYCEKCKKNHYSYHSCKNRHCPKCGSKDSAKAFPQINSTNIIMINFKFFILFSYVNFFQYPQIDNSSFVLNRDLFKKHTYAIKTQPINQY